MPTTTNYGWTTPADTDLVKDGAAAIRTLGSSIDSTLKTQIDAQIPDSLLTTTGDVIYASGASTPARLGIGSTGQVLTVSGGLPTWATPASGSLTLLSTTTLTGATTTISSISQSYKSLYGIVYGFSNATATGSFRLAPNGSAISVNYTSNGWDAANGGLNPQGDVNTYFVLTPRNLLFTDTTNIMTFNINNYSSSSTYKTMSGIIHGIISASNQAIFNISGVYRSNTAISSLVFSNSGGNLSTGTVLLYGVN